MNIKKNTKELLNEIKQTSNLKEYFNDNEQEFYNLELKDYLNQLLKSKGLSKSDVIARSGLHQIYAYHLLKEFQNKTQPYL